MRKVRSAAGRAYSRRVTSVMTPSVPQEPVSNRERSKPATFFTTFPPARMVSPRPFTNSRPSSKSRGEPKLEARGPADAVARVAPMVRARCSPGYRPRWLRLQRRSSGLCPRFSRGFHTVPLLARVHRYHLAGIRPMVRVEDSAQLAHRVERALGEDRLHVAHLVET